MFHSGPFTSVRAIRMLLFLCACAIWSAMLSGDAPAYAQFDNWHFHIVPFHWMFWVSFLMYSICSHIECSSASGDFFSRVACFLLCNAVFFVCACVFSLHFNFLFSYREKRRLTSTHIKIITTVPVLQKYSHLCAKPQGGRGGVKS